MLSLAHSRLASGTDIQQAWKSDSRRRNLPFGLQAFKLYDEGNTSPSPGVIRAQDKISVSYGKTLAPDLSRLLISHG